MEIPFTVKARRDTGLYNAKIGIWLFLASEVMLFGGLFSGYIFLRIYADYPWPERALPITPGLVNTFVLIGSSVTVVFAWASLKLRRWRSFQLFMFITLLCAAGFMVLKGLEYKAKLEHQAIRLKDDVIIEGHVHKAKLTNDGKVHEIHHHAQNLEVEKPSTSSLVMVSSHHEDAMGHEAHKAEDGSHHGSEHGEHDVAGVSFKQNMILFQTEEITVDLSRFNNGIINNLVEQIAEMGGSATLIENYAGKPAHYKEEVIVAKAGSHLSVDLLKRARKHYLTAKKNNSKVGTNGLRQAWKEVKAKPENKGKPGYVIKDQLKISPDNNKFYVQANPTVKFKVSKSVPLLFKPRAIEEADERGILRDGTLLRGQLDKNGSAIALSVDAIDFTWVAREAERRGIEPILAIESTGILQNKSVRTIWETHKKKISELEKTLLEKHKTDKAGNPKKVPTEKERYRIGWKDLVRYGSDGKIDLGPLDGFAGPDHKADYAKKAFVSLAVPREQVAYESVFEPRWNTYYALYFLITALHGLHVIGGALVLAYFLFFGKKMYLKEPEHLANRVEVGGLFWHFVDLVWIFLFPILYLM